jgi:hypothetical protein
MRLPVLLFVVLAGAAQGQAALLPDTPQVVDKEFLTMTAVNAAATAMDAYTTVQWIRRDRTCDIEGGSPMLYGAEPKTLRTSTVMGGLFVIGVAASYEFKRHRLRVWKIPIWIVPQVVNAGAHIDGSINNWRICR